MSIRGISGDAHFFEESMNLDRIRKLLDNKLGVAGHAEKLEAMKALLASISKGEDVSMFFADVVKNVIVASVEVKKMVYMYLVHYADANAQCRELALLSINSFQKDLADANQLIRALALRVMTSIRVRDIWQIQLIAIRKCAADSSPYVRKCAANAISKIFIVDPDQKDVCAEIIGKLLNDSSTMVLGSAVQALNEVCPDRLDLLHQPFRKICHLLADIDEWGQVVTINVLIRYCREQFQTPEILNHEDPELIEAKKNKVSNLFPKRKTKRGFYSDEENDGSDPESSKNHGNKGPYSDGSSPFHLGTTVPRGEILPSIGSVFRSNALASGISGGEELDEDHRLLLRSSIPLLKSRNSAVVLAVATLHYYCGTHSVATNTLIGKSLVRIMRNQREIQFVVLTVISSMSSVRPDMFRPFLPDFFVRATDPSYARKLKLDILTTLVTDANVSVILREFQAYVRHVDKAFVTTTVRALGRVADAMPSVAERCLQGLMRLVRSTTETVVAESVVIIRQLLQQQFTRSSRGEKERIKVVRSLAGMMVSGRVSSPSARASIVWMLGEFSSATCGMNTAVETLRLLTKTFSDEAMVVRLQVLTLAVKVALRAPQDRTIQLLLQYVMELAKYDAEYDVRDRTRLIRAVLTNSTNTDSSLNPHIIFNSMKPAPLIGCEEESKLRFTLGTLSSIVHHVVPGYQPLPLWRTSPSDKSLREEISTTMMDSDGHGSGYVKDKKKSKKEKPMNGFYSDEQDEESESESESNEDSTDESDESQSDASSEEESESEYESESEQESEQSSSEEEESDVSSEEERPVRRSHQSQRKPVDPFDPMNFFQSPVSQSSSSNPMNDLLNLNLTTPCQPSIRHDLYSMNGLSIQYSFLRQPSMYSPTMNLIQVWLTNTGTQPIPRVMIQSLNPSTPIVGFSEVAVLFPGAVPCMVQVHVDFKACIDTIPLNLSYEKDGEKVNVEVELVPKAGELLVPHPMQIEEFFQRIGMADSTTYCTKELQIVAGTPMTTVMNATLKECHVAHIVEKMGHSTNVLRCKFAGRQRSGMGEIVLIGIEWTSGGNLKLFVVSKDKVLGQHMVTSILRELPKLE